MRNEPSSESSKLRTQMLTEVSPNASLVSSWCNVLLAVSVLLLLPALRARAQSADFEPATLSRKRAEIYFRSARVPVPQFEGEIDHLAVLSETCRAEYGSKACGLAEKALDSDGLEDRYAYYVKQPVEARFSARSISVNRSHWERHDEPAPK